MSVDASRISPKCKDGTSSIGNQFDRERSRVISMRVISPSAATAAATATGENTRDDCRSFDISSSVQEREREKMEVHI